MTEFAQMVESETLESLGSRSSWNTMLSKFSAFSLIGNTPLVDIYTDSKLKVSAKLEYQNPTGSLKDRTAYYLCKAAWIRGDIYKGSSVVESSSGNTGIALSLIGRVYDFNVHLVVKDTLSSEKRTTIEQLGARVIEVDSRLPPESGCSYQNMARTLSVECGYYYLNQHDNPDNKEAHYVETGKEIWKQTAGDIDYFVCGIGTGGTISGAARYLKEQNHKITVIGVEPVGSVFKEYMQKHTTSDYQTYSLEGLGDSRIPANIDFSVIDDIWRVHDTDAHRTCLDLATRKGLFCGLSSGAVYRAILDRRHEVSGSIVTIFPDGFSRYQSMFRN